MAVFGYARVASGEWEAAARGALVAAGCTTVVCEVVGGALLEERPGLRQVLGVLGEGDVLTVLRLDDLGSSTRQVAEVVASLGRRGTGFVALRDRVDTAAPGGHMVFSLLAAFAEL